MIGVDTTFLIHFEFAEGEHHAGAREALSRAAGAGDMLLLTPQVIAEFLHVATDPKRFTEPLPMTIALDRADAWLQSAETRLLMTTDASIKLASDWMRHHQLGRKRILDTQLAATFWTHGVKQVLTLNGRDFAALAPFEIVVF